MAETTLLRSSANVRNASPNATASKPQAQLSGAHPVVQVNMNAGGPQQQGAQQVRQGVQILPPKAGTRNFSTGGLPNQPAKQSVVILPPKERGAAEVSPLTADQLLLCRHLADKYLGEQRAADGEAQVDGAASDPTAGSQANIKLAEATIVAIDVAMAAMTAALAVAAAPRPIPTTAIVPPRTVAAGTRSSQGVASATPRRVARPAPPPVIVRMDADGPVPVQADPSTAAVQLDPNPGEDDARG